MHRSLMHTCLIAALVLGQQAPGDAQTYNGQRLEGRVTYVPAGTTVEAELTSAIDSSVSKAGDRFTAKLYAPLYMGGDLVFPANTVLEGQLTAAEEAGLAGINGMIGLRLTAAVTPDGTRYPLSAVVTANQAGPDKLHEDKQGIMHGRSKKETVTRGIARTALWTGGGTLLGIIFAPIVAGAVGAGAIAGVATGGAVGLGSNLWRRGKEAKLPSGTRIQFALDQPMSLSTGIAVTGGPTL